MSLHVEVATHEDALHEIATEWEALDALTMPRKPFTSPAWNRLWWKHFRRNGRNVCDELRLFIVRDATGMLVAVAPMMLTNRPSHGPLRTRELQFLGADSNITEVRGMVTRPGQETAALEALSLHLATRSDWDWVQWRGLPGGATPELLPGFREGRELPFYYLQLEGSWEALRASLPRNVKESLRKCYNSIARDGHDWIFEVVSDAEALAPSLRRLLDLHAMRADAGAGVAHLNAFSKPRDQAFIAEFVAETGAAGGVRMFALRVGDTHVAMRLGFVHGNELYLYYSGFDPEWGRYSVMTTVVAEAIKWAIGEGLERVSLSTGTDVSKTRWRPLAVTYFEGYQAANRIRSRLAFEVVDRLRRRRAPKPGQPSSEAA